MQLVSDLVFTLKEQLQEKDKQIQQQQQSIKELTVALENTTNSLKAAQALHAGTMQQNFLSSNFENQYELTFKEKFVDERVENIEKLNKVQKKLIDKFEERERKSEELINALNNVINSEEKYSEILQERITELEKEKDRQEIQKVIELYKEAKEEIQVIKQEELEKQNNKKWYKFWE